MINEKRLVEQFMHYVTIDSPTKEEKDFADFISVELKDLGFEVTIDDAGPKVGSNTGNVIGRLPATCDGEPILFSCHMDTVSPGRGIKPKLEDGVIRSDGTTILGGDDKAGIAAVVEAIRSLVESGQPHGPIEVAFTIYEEGGLHGAKNLDVSKIDAKRAFVLDSGGNIGEIIIQGPAQDKIDATIKGKPAHAGVAPEEGISAIIVAAEAIAKMKLLRVDEETTANIGVISGGEVTNIVTPEVMLKAEARSLVNEKLEAQSAHMIRTLEETAAAHGATVEIDHRRMYPAFGLDASDKIVMTVKGACEKIGVKPYTTASGGGSDTNILNDRGITAVNLGIGERKPHTLEEHLYVKDLIKSAELVVALIEAHKA